MKRLKDVVSYGYDHNTYNLTRTDKLRDEDLYVIDYGFERMVENSEPYISDEEMFNYQAKILELGCGNGIPYTRYLSRLGKVVGCDVSKSQVGCARHNVPNGRFIHKDVMELKLMHKYDMIVMFNSFYNIDRKDKYVLLSMMRDWLQPYGVIVITTYGEETFIKKSNDFYGAPMTWHHIAPERFVDMFKTAGLVQVEHLWRIDTLGSKNTHLWILEKPASERKV